MNCDQIVPIVLVFGWIAAALCMGFYLGSVHEAVATWNFRNAAHNCAGKLRVELHRRTIEPRSEYEALIDEAIKLTQKGRR